MISYLLLFGPKGPKPVFQGNGWLFIGFNDLCFGGARMQLWWTGGTPDKKSVLCVCFCLNLWTNKRSLNWNIGKFVYAFFQANTWGGERPVAQIRYRRILFLSPIFLHRSFFLRASLSRASSCHRWGQKLCFRVETLQNCLKLAFLISNPKVLLLETPAHACVCTRGVKLCAQI